MIDAYEGTPSAHTRAGIGRHNGHEAGDPAKAAAAIIGVLEAPQAPLRLVLGADALGMVRHKIDGTLKLVAEWEAVSTATAFGAE